MTHNSNHEIKETSFWQFFRLVFVAFSLYLSADAFYRWDGFSYYAPFSEFIPSVALALILWSMIAVCAAMILWSFFKLLEWVANRVELKIGIDHLLLNAAFFAILGVLAWKGKKIVWPDIQTSFFIKLVVLASVVSLSACLTWLFRNKAGRLTGNVHERLTPLVWICGALIVFSFPVVIYHTWIKNTAKTITHTIAGSSGEMESRPNIILVTFDALAAREMSLYGYSETTTPLISEWAKNATVFNMVEAGSNFTTPATASLMTGKRLWTHQTYHIAGAKPLRSNSESLPSLLKENGYFNMAFVVNPFASVEVLGIARSFHMAPPVSEFGSSGSLFGWKFGIVDKALYRIFGDKIRIHNWVLKNEFILSKFLNLISRNISQTPVPPERAFNRFLDAIDGKVPEPFFAWIHVFPPHDPYLPPGTFKGDAKASQELRTYKSQERLIEDSYTYLFQHRSFPEEMKPAVELMRSYYDEFILYSDRQFGSFIEEFNKRKIENTVVILSADHGESFDHGYFTHGGPFLYEQVTQIPLIIKEPGQIEGREVNALIEQIDIPATILDFVDLPVPEWMEGRSLIPLIRGEELPQRPAFSMNFEGNRSRGHKIVKGSIAVWEGDYKLIHYLERNESLLFNINEDPDELNNLVDNNPEISRRLLNLIYDNLEKANRKTRSN